MAVARGAVEPRGYGRYADKCNTTWLPDFTLAHNSQGPPAIASSWRINEFRRGHAVVAAREDTRHAAHCGDSSHGRMRGHELEPLEGRAPVSCAIPEAFASTSRSSLSRRLSQRIRTSFWCSLVASPSCRHLSKSLP